MLLLLFFFFHNPVLLELSLNNFYIYVFFPEFLLSNPSQQHNKYIQQFCFKFTYCFLLFPHCAGHFKIQALPATKPHKSQQIQ